MLAAKIGGATVLSWWPSSSCNLAMELVAAHQVGTWWWTSSWL